MSDIVHMSQDNFRTFTSMGLSFWKRNIVGEEVVELYYLFSLGMEGTKGFRLSLRDLQLDR